MQACHAVHVKGCLVGHSYRVYYVNSTHMMVALQRMHIILLYPVCTRGLN